MVARNNTGRMWRVRSQGWCIPSNWERSVLEKGQKSTKSSRTLDAQNIFTKKNVPKAHMRSLLVNLSCHVSLPESVTYLHARTDSGFKKTTMKTQYSKWGWGHARQNSDALGEIGVNSYAPETNSFPLKIGLPKMNRVFKQSFFMGYLNFRMFQGGSELECIAQGSLCFTSCHISQKQNRCPPFKSLSKQACAIFAERLCIWINSAKPISMLFFLHSQDLTLMDSEPIWWYSFDHSSFTIWWIFTQNLGFKEMPTLPILLLSMGSFRWFKSTLRFEKKSLKRIFHNENWRDLEGRRFNGLIVEA